MYAVEQQCYQLTSAGADCRSGYIEIGGRAKFSMHDLSNYLVLYGGFHYHNIISDIMKFVYLVFTKISRATKINFAKK